MAANSRVSWGNHVVAAALVAGVLFGHPQAAHANLLAGLMKIVGGVIGIPKSIIVGTMTGPPILGTLTGTLIGAVNGVAMVAGGAVETVVSLIPLALKALPFLPVFL